jgi:hypothetical protein
MVYNLNNPQSENERYVYLLEGEDTLNWTSQLVREHVVESVNPTTILSGSEDSKNAGKEAYGVDPSPILILPIPVPTPESGTSKKTSPRLSGALEVNCASAVDLLPLRGLK